jgi:hypothetical protein
MRTLDQIFIETGTDKASVHQTGAHDYARHYDRIFTHLREEEFKFLEIGVGGGESIRGWLEYFTRARIFGVDLYKDTNPWNTVGAATHERYTFVQGPQQDPVFWQCFLADQGGDWGVIVDDGGHTSEQIIKSFDSLWPHVRPGGYYCIEDIGVCFSPGSVFCTAGYSKHNEFVKMLVDQCLEKGAIDRIHVSKELCILKKG